MLHGDTVHPADLLTRGLTFAQFHNSSLWWHGPKWLLDEGKWPSWNMQSVSLLYIAVLTAEEFVIIAPLIQSSSGLHKVITPDNYSSLERLLAVTAYVQCFVYNLKRPWDARMIGPPNSRVECCQTEMGQGFPDQVFINEISMLRRRHTESGLW